MSEPASISSGIAERYATAVFGIARENNNLAKLESSVDDLHAALDTSEDLRDMISSPVLSREVQGKAIAAVAQAVGVSPVMKNVLGVMAEKRRLFALPHMLTHLTAMIAEHKGEVTAEVISAQPLSAAQSKSLADTLKARVGQDVKIKASVDDTLIGGLVVKVGSKMIDTSVRAKLNALQNVMKEVG